MRYIFVFIMLLWSIAVQAATLQTDSCKIDVVFNNDGSVTFNNINGSCNVKLYNHNTLWRTAEYNLESNETRPHDTYKCVFCPTTKVCVDNECVSK